MAGGYVPHMGRHGFDLYSPTGKPEKRPYGAGVKVTRREKDYYTDKYGSVGAALRHLINEDQRRLEEQ